jgi:hypothetical protein
MAEKNISQIKVGQYGISIVGIDRAIAELGETHAHRSDADIREAMLDRLGKDNYIYPRARVKTGKSLDFSGEPSYRLTTSAAIPR